MANYEVKKQGFRETKADRLEKENEKKQEKLMAKVEKLDLEKAVVEMESLQRASYLAPHQHERRRFLEQAISILRKQAKAAPTSAAADETGAAPPLPKHRVRSRSSSSDRDTAEDNSGAKALRVDDRWEAVLSCARPDSSRSAAPSVVVVHAGSAAGASLTADATKFVPRVVRKAGPTLTSGTALHGNTLSTNYPSGHSTADDQVNSFLDDLL